MIFRLNILFWSIFLFVNSIELPKIDKILKLKNNENYQKKYEFLDQFSVVNIFQNAGEKSKLQNISINLSTECVEDLGIIWASFQKNSLIPQNFTSGAMIQMIDSSWRFPAGFLSGAFTFWGYPPECRRIDFEFPWRQRHFIGSYSRVFLNAYWQDYKISKNCEPLENPFTLLDFCTPKSCANHQDLLFLVRLIQVPGPNGTSHSPVCDMENIDEQNDTLDYQGYITSIIMGLVIGIGLLASFVDYFLLTVDSKNRQKLLIQSFLSFSLYNNIREIFTVRSQNSAQIGPIHCIRFWSISWVIMGHVFNLGSSFLNNTYDLFRIVKDVPTQILVNAYFSVDSFFFISGVLLTYIWFKEFKRNRRSVMSSSGWFLFYFHRILRISPPYFMAIAFYTWVFPPLTTNMPVYLLPTAKYGEIANCKKYWWTNFLFIQNFVHYNSQCFGQGWYVAADMQMFLFTPLLLIPLSMHPITGVAVGSILFLGSTAANIETVYKHHYYPSPYIAGPIDPKLNGEKQYGLLIYDAPWIRCQIYIMGILVGYFLQMKQKLTINWALNIILWMVSLSLMLTVVLGLHDYMNGTEISLFWRAMYSALSKPTWGLGLTWILISCYYGYGGPINQFMSWNIWVPLSRLSYCVYLLHLMVIAYMFGFSQAPIIYSGFSASLLNWIVPSIFFSFVFAVIWSAAFEISISKLEITLIKNFMSKPKAVKKSEDGAENWKI